jgi:hypothetical protein
MKTVVFWVVVPYSLVKVYGRFRCDYCPHHQGSSLFTFYSYNRKLFEKVVVIVVAAVLVVVVIPVLVVVVVVVVVERCW